MVNICRGFAGIFRIHPPAQKVETICSIESSLTSHQTARWHVPEDGTFDSYHRNDVISRRQQRLGSHILSCILVFQETNAKPEMTTKYAISNSSSTHCCVLWRMSWCKNTLRSKWWRRGAGKGGRSGGLFITGPPATLLMYRTRCSIRAGGTGRAQFRNWQVYGIIASIKVSTIKTWNCTNPPSIKVTHD